MTTGNNMTEAAARQKVQALFSYLRAQGDADYIGEAISQLQHSLQAADLAAAAVGPDEEETILAALLHDVGRFIPDSDDRPRMISPDGTYVGTEDHEIVGEKYLRDLGFSDKVCSIVGAHVWAKRYLCATEPGYWEALSKSSKETLKFQGGIFTEAQVQEANKDPYLAQKLAVRRWDDQAKVPNKEVPGLDAYEDAAVRCLTKSQSPSIKLHGRTYKLPRRPTVVICVDGFDPQYLIRGIEDGILPTMASFVQSGFHATAHVAMPTLTNPNNVSIITGAPTSVHGISGNYFLDRDSWEEKMITDASLVRGSTILAEMAKAGVRVAAVTAKDKLCKILAHGLDKESNICFSAQKADEETQRWLGLPRPSQYSGDLSLFVLDAGVKILHEGRADLLYLTLSDYIQHTYAPGARESDAFLRAVDTKISTMVELGAVVAVTGDHGMSDKCNSDGSPNLLFLQDELEKEFGEGCARVICPITDPFVKHHGALGSFVRVYMRHMKGAEDSVLAKTDLSSMMELAGRFPQVDVVLSGDDAAELYEMPRDREGDFVVVSKKHAVIGSKASEHDLGGLQGHRLRSHGGLSELAVPLLMSEPRLDGQRSAKTCTMRNFDIFDLVLNHSA